MSLTLPPAAGYYDPADQERVRDALRRESRQTLKRGQDIELVDGRLIQTAPNGSQFVIGVDNAGNRTSTPL